MTQVQAPPPRERTGRFRIPKVAIIIAVLVVVAGALVGGAIVLVRHHAAAVQAAAQAAVGNEAMAAARPEINTLNTMDFHATKADYQAWLGATAGILNSRLASSESALQVEFQTERLVTSGTITQAKVAAVDTVNGTATILGTETENVTAGGATTVRHNGFRADMLRTAAGWKLTDFNTTPLAN